MSSNPIPHVGRFSKAALLDAIIEHQALSVDLFIDPSINEQNTTYLFSIVLLDQFIDVIHEAKWLHLCPIIIVHLMPYSIY